MPYFAVSLLKWQVIVLTSGVSASTRKRVILGAMKGGNMGGGAVVVTSYGLVSAKPELFAPRGNKLKWDYVILDEGHKIKNRSTRYERILFWFCVDIGIFHNILNNPFNSVFHTKRYIKHTEKKQP